MREHLKVIERVSGKPHPRLSNAPRCPDGMAMLWRDFMSLRASAGSTGMGPSRISYTEMDGYQRLNGFRFAPWEVEAIRRADNTWFQVRSEQTQ